MGASSRIEAQEGPDWTRQAAAASQAGVDPLHACAQPAYFIAFTRGFYWLDVELEVRRGCSSKVPSYSSPMSVPF